MRWPLLVFLYFAFAVLFATQAVSAKESAAHEAVSVRQQHAQAPVRHRDMVAEALKQTAEQPLHFLMSAGPIWASRYLTAVPWYGWAIVPVLAYREWRQWPSERWWDPPLDAVFLLLGTIFATWQRGGSLNLLTLRWQRGRRRRALLAPRQA